MHTHLQHTTALHLLQKSIFVGRDPGVSDGRETCCLELVVFGDAIADPLVERPRARRRQRYEVLCAVYEFAVEASICVPRDAATVRLRRLRRDLPVLEGGGIDDVLVAA